MSLEKTGTSQPQQQQPPQHHYQRFSWQPVPEENAPAYEEVQRGGNFRQHYQHPPVQQQHVSSNAEMQNRHFSYAQTPVEHEAFFYVASPTDPPMPSLSQHPHYPLQSVQSSNTSIDPRAQSLFNPLTAALPQPQSPSQSAYLPSPSQLHELRPPVSPVAPHQSTQNLHFSPVSPMPAPQAYCQQPMQPPKVTVPQSSHTRKMSGLSPINTNVGQNSLSCIPAVPSTVNHNSPLSQKTPVMPISPDSPAKKSAIKDNRQSYANEPYSPHGFNSNQANNFHAIFSPDAAHGPNGLDFASHLPGQIAHPNMESGKSPQWTHSICSCNPEVSTCLTGLFCPCILYGRTSYRLSQKSAKKDPTDMLGHSSANGHCMMMSVSCGLWWLFPMLQRTRIRHLYKLEGSLGSDLLRGCCCCCCVAVQNEREVKSREETSRRWAGPASTDVYTRPDEMMYKRQQ